jgi:short subunit dehydrogenase-like uncharacterized protein
MAAQKQWMIYGANGYTGELIAREARRRGESPVLAGRSNRVERLAQELGFEHRVFDLEDNHQIGQHLQGISLVLHCAGPFSATSAPMIEGCLQAGAHYLDITGEISVFEHAHAQAARAKKSGIVICPGVGFDVIPTDCVAAALKKALPDATHLALGFDSRSGFSPGTAKTSVEGLASGGRARINGKISKVPMAWKVRRIRFGRDEKLAMTIPWGDVCTAWYSTGIPDIEVYIPVSERVVKSAKLSNYVRPLLGLSLVQDFMKKRIGKTVKGPDAATRDKLTTAVWGEASNAAGQKKTARITTANGYSLTVTGSLAVVEYLLKNTVPAGSYTPSLLLGAELVSTLPGSGPLVIE